MNIVAFDLGSTIGWATNHSDMCSHKIFIGSRAKRLYEIKQWFSNLHWKPYNIVVYETPLARGQDATRILWGIAGILEACATEAQLPVIDIAVPTIKKFATGYGMAGKLEMMIAARKYGFVPQNEHEADAVCLLKYAEANLEKAA